TNPPLPTLQVPNAPTAPSVTALSKSSLKLIWTAPSNNGGSPITGYKIQRNGTTLVNNTGTTITNYTNSGLLASHQQTYRIAAWNSVGLGPYSVNVTGKTLDQTATGSSVTENLGQMVSEFVHRYNAKFKEQREATVTAIKACIQNVKDATPEHRKQAKADCKATLSAIREKYKADRKQFQIEFKHLKETAKEELKIARESASITKSDVKEFQKDLNHAKKELKQQEKDLKKELKQQEKDAKKKSKDKNHEEDDD
ncbi:MAG: fibronectin type III domain-containing protein, partial [Nitrosopumilaceae archaeon]